MRTCIFRVWISASFLFAQSPSTSENDIPAVVTFVAPPYPRAARDQRKMGKTISQMKVSKDGLVTDVKTVSANEIFEKQVLDALRQWRFKPSEKEHILEVICSFEFIDDKCGGTHEHPITAETYVSAELPSLIHVRVGLECIETSVSQRRH